MAHEIKDELMKDFIKSVANKNGIHEGECVVRYGGSMYLVNFDKDTVVLQAAYRWGSEHDK